MRKLTFSCLIIFLCFCSVSNAEVMWDKVYGGALYESGGSVIQTFDGGFLVIGRTDSFSLGESDIWMIKTNIFGDPQWFQTYGGWNAELSGEVLQIANGGYVLCGTTRSVTSPVNLSEKFSGKSIILGESSNYSLGVNSSATPPVETYNVWILKTDSWGNLLWNRIFGGDQDDFGYAIDQTTDGGFILAGTTYGATSCANFELQSRTIGVTKTAYDNQQGWLIKTDADGNMEWNNTYGGADGETSYAVKQTSDRGYIFAGETWSSEDSSSDGWLVKTDAAGNEEWNHFFGSGGVDYFKTVAETADGGFVAAGTSHISGQGFQAWLVKTDASGQELWSRLFKSGDEAGFNSLDITVDGGFILTGYQAPPGRSSNLYLVKTDSDGNEEWNQIFGSENGEKGYSVKQTFDSGFIVTGRTSSYGVMEKDLWLLYYNPVQNQPPNPPTLLTPEDNSIIESGLVTFTWINNGDPDGDAVGSWLYAVGPGGQVISMEAGAEGYIEGVEISKFAYLPAGQEWAWSVYIYDPNYNSIPNYNFQLPFWHFTTENE